MRLQERRHSWPGRGSYYRHRERRRGGRADVEVVAGTGEPDVAGTGQHDDATADTLTLPSARRPGRWRARWPILLIVAWAAMAAVDLAVLGVGAGSPRAATAGASHVTRAAEKPRAIAPPRASAATTPSSSARPTPAMPALQVLPPAAAWAIGPSGPGSGDNASHAYLAIDASTATAWLSDWYRTAAFGNLQAGTGLLIDLGKPSSIVSVQLLLSATPGADLQLLTGNTGDRSQMRLQASASDASGSVALTVASPAPARYLVIWFTLLPPDSAGTFQAAVYDVRIEGTP